MGKCVSSSNDTEQTSNTNKNQTNNDDGKKKNSSLMFESGKSIEQQYQFRRPLGKGASCRVVEAISRDNPSHKVAIKIITKGTPLYKTLYEHEVDILRGIQHGNIVEFFGNTEDQTSYYVLTGLLEGGELFDRIVDPSHKITEKMAAALVRDMLHAIQYLHDHSIVHRDLKPENFVFENESAAANIVLIDFGCAKRVIDDREYKDLVGTAYYLAPELVAHSSVIKRTGRVLKCADVWSLGVITYVMLTGRPPFRGHNNKAIFTNIVKQPLRFPSDVPLSAGFKSFVARALVKNPDKRITVEEALRDPWIKGVSATENQLNKDVQRYLRQFNYQSKLKKAITRCLAKNMSSEPEQEVKRHFERLDKDGNGMLDAEELKFLLLDMGLAPAAAIDEAKAMLKAADENNDGRIDFEEFKAMWHRKLLSQHEQYIHRVFAVFDDNGDGFIDAKELENVLGEDFSDIKKMIEEVDENGDGKLSFAEFQRAMQEHTNGERLEQFAGIGGDNVNENDRVNEEIADDEDDHKEEN
mmetsp:Transcript_17443/g.27299  ORF Transcript_17443/g.27299 Transcript_17443/m.27299 type:complete len:526 (+) Transcript_17443:35-1612(+)|eukprot:CAMPEP_0202731562 /NCGR_PEP_ID=MMETSP1385-20130828/187212_1 /ASSEMBLY_ACC=CAM_ASM_000861 /TAXON_ID=933848 /ORGANISM="Elphidium margaritaceum" /LENGTH=525 /DNA_ID=CAMNT_0049397863 /DNA_START=2386 /DNA_END=3963 /DNA_ORIENTATION=+